METTTQTTTMPTVQESTDQKEITFGNGRYSAVMKELFSDCQRILNLPEGQAEKVARTYGAELGRLDKANGDITIKLGKLTKLGTMNLTETTKLKGIHMTYALSIAKLCVLLQECTTYGLNVPDSDITLKPAWVEWLTKE